MKKILVILIAVALMTGCAVSNRSITVDKDGKTEVKNQNGEIVFLGPYQAYRTAETSRLLNQVLEDERRNKRDEARHEQMLKKIQFGEEEVGIAGFPFIVINESHDEKMIVLQELDRYPAKEWTIPTLSPQGSFVQFLETGRYRILVYRNGYKNSVWTDWFRVYPERQYYYAGPKNKGDYCGWYMITGQ